jgi:hypothetical protein
MTQANFPRSPKEKENEFLPEEDVFARNSPPKKNDDWAMTRVKSGINNDPKYDAFDQTPTNLSRPQNNNWGTNQVNPPNPQSNDWGVTQVNPPKSQATGDWDKTQGNINISPNDWDKTQVNIAVPPSSIPKSSNDDWGMTQANIAVPPRSSPVNLDNTMYGFSPQKTEFGNTETNFNVSPKAKSQTYTPEIIPQKVEQTASTNDAMKWIYFLAGAFSMFVFMVFFLGVIYLLFLFK